MLKTSPPHLWKGRVLECYCNWKVLWDIHVVVSLVNEQKSQDRKKSTNKFYLRKGDDLLLKGDTNKDKRCFPRGWIIVVMRFMLIDSRRTGRKHYSAGYRFQSLIKLDSQVPRNNVVNFSLKYLPRKPHNLLQEDCVASLSLHDGDGCYLVSSGAWP